MGPGCRAGRRPTPEGGVHRRARECAVHLPHRAPPTAGVESKKKEKKKKKLFFPPFDLPPAEVRAEEAPVTKGFLNTGTGGEGRGLRGRGRGRRRRRGFRVRLFLSLSLSFLSLLFFRCRLLRWGGVHFCLQAKGRIRRISEIPGFLTDPRGGADGFVEAVAEAVIVSQMAAGNSFDEWQKDAFFSAAEEVQDSADVYVSSFAFDVTEDFCARRLFDVLFDSEDLIFFAAGHNRL